MVRLWSCEDGHDTSEGTSNADMKVLVLVGSLRAASVNRQIAELAAEVAAPDGDRRDGVRGAGRRAVLQRGLDVADNADAPAAVVALRAAAAEADAVLVVTPEYNGSIPAVLKNAIDWLSRPVRRRRAQGQAAGGRRRALGQYGGVWAHDETRKSFGIAGARVVEDIKLSVPFGTLDGKHPRENAELVAERARRRGQAGRRSRADTASCTEAAGGSLLTCRRLCC